MIEPGFLLTNNTYRTGLSGHIGDIAEKMPITLFNFDMPIDFVNTSGSTKQIKFISSGNSDIVYDLNSSSSIIKKRNTSEIILDIPYTELQDTNKFNKQTNFNLKADSESFKSTSLSTLHIQSNLSESSKNYLNIQKIFNVTSQKSNNYLTENLTVTNRTFSPTKNGIPIYHNAQEITITLTFNKKLKTTPYLKIKDTDMSIFYNNTQVSNILGNIITTGWEPKYEFKIPGTNRKINSNNAFRDDINFEIVDGLSSSNKIKHIFDKEYTDQSANIFYISDDGTAPVIQSTSTTSTNPLTFDLDFSEEVSSNLTFQTNQTIQSADLTKDNLSISLSGTTPEIAIQPSYSDHSLVKVNNSKYTLSVTLNHIYFDSNNKIIIKKKDSNPIYDKNFNIFETDREITLPDNKPARIKNISNLSNDNKQVTIQFSEIVCQQGTRTNNPVTTITNNDVEFNLIKKIDNSLVQTTITCSQISSNDNITHTITGITYSNINKTHDDGTNTPLYDLVIYPKQATIEDLEGNLSLEKNHANYNILNNSLNNSLNIYRIGLNTIPHIVSITSNKTQFRISDTTLEFYLKISPKITHPTSLPTLTFNNNNALVNPIFDLSSVSSTDNPNNYYTTITYKYYLKSDQDLNNLQITDIDTTQLSNLNKDNINSKSPTFDIYTIRPIFTVNYESIIIKQTEVIINFTFNPTTTRNLSGSTLTYTLNPNVTQSITTSYNTNSNQQSITFSNLNTNTSYLLSLKLTDPFGNSYTHPSFTFKTYDYVEEWIIGGYLGIGTSGSYISSTVSSEYYFSDNINNRKAHNLFTQSTQPINTSMYPSYASNKSKTYTHHNNSKNGLTLNFDNTGKNFVTTSHVGSTSYQSYSAINYVQWSDQPQTYIVKEQEINSVIGTEGYNRAKVLNFNKDMFLTSYMVFRYNQMVGSWGGTTSETRFKLYYWNDSSSTWTKIHESLLSGSSYSGTNTITFDLNNMSSTYRNSIHRHSYDYYTSNIIWRPFIDLTQTGTASGTTSYYQKQAVKAKTYLVETITKTTSSHPYAGPQTNGGYKFYLKGTILTNQELKTPDPNYEPIFNIKVGQTKKVKIYQPINFYTGGTDKDLYLGILFGPSNKGLYGTFHGQHGLDKNPWNNNSIVWDLELKYFNKIDDTLNTSDYSYKFLNNVYNIKSALYTHTNNSLGEDMYYSGGSHASSNTQYGYPPINQELYIEVISDQSGLSNNKRRVRIWCNRPTYTTASGNTSVSDYSGKYKEATNGIILNWLSASAYSPSANYPSLINSVWHTNASKSYGQCIWYPVTTSRSGTHLGDWIMEIEPISPTVIEYNPTQGATNISVDTNIYLTFSEEIELGTSTIVTITPEGSSAINITISSNSINGSILTIIPPNDLVYNKKYTLNIPSTLIKNKYDVGFSGLTYDFTTGTGLINSISLSSDAIFLSSTYSNHHIYQSLSLSLSVIQHILYPWFSFTSPIDAPPDGMPPQRPTGSPGSDAGYTAATPHNYNNNLTYTYFRNPGSSTNLNNSLRGVYGSEIRYIMRSYSSTRVIISDNELADNQASTASGNGNVEIFTFGRESNAANLSIAHRTPKWDEAEQPEIRNNAVYMYDPGVGTQTKKGSFTISTSGTKHISIETSAWFMTPIAALAFEKTGNA